jgi:hypothetical protein
MRTIVETILRLMIAVIITPLLLIVALCLLGLDERQDAKDVAHFAIHCVLLGRAYAPDQSKLYPDFKRFP